MGTIVEGPGGIALTIHGMNAAGIDYERKRDPSPEPASPFLAINDPRLADEPKFSKADSPETTASRPAMLPKQERLGLERAKDDPDRIEPIKDPKAGSGPPKGRPSPAGPGRSATAKQPADERNKLTSKTEGKDASRQTSQAKLPAVSAPKQAPATKSPAAPTSKRAPSAKPPAASALKQAALAKPPAPSTSKQPPPTKSSAGLPSKQTPLAKPPVTSASQQPPPAKGSAPPPLKQAPPAKESAGASTKPRTQTPVGQNAPAKKSAVPAPVKAQQGPSTPAKTATPTSSKPARKSRWGLINFFRTPGPGPGPATLLDPSKLPGSSKAPDFRVPDFGGTDASGKDTEPPRAKAPGSSRAFASADSPSAGKSPALARSPSSARHPNRSSGSSPATLGSTHERKPSQSLDPNPQRAYRGDLSAEPSPKSQPVHRGPSLEPQELARREKHRSPTPPPQDSASDSIPAADSKYPPSMLLDVEIPNVSMDRYSVMFSSVLEPRHSSLMLRRRAQLEQLRVPEIPRLPEVYKEEPVQEGIPKPTQRRQTVPSPNASPGFSLFPTVPTLAPRKPVANRPSPLNRITTASSDTPQLVSPGKPIAKASSTQQPSSRKATPQKLSLLSSTTRSSDSPESLKDRWASDTSPTSTAPTPIDECDGPPLGAASGACSSAVRDSGSSTYPFKLELPIMMPEPIIGRISPTPSHGRELAHSNSTKADSTKSVESSRIVPLKLETTDPIPGRQLAPKFDPVQLELERLQASKVDPFDSEPLKPEPLNVKPAHQPRSASRPPPPFSELPSSGDKTTESARSRQIKRKPSLSRQASQKRQPPTPSASAPSPARPILKLDITTPACASPRTIEIPKKKSSVLPLLEVSKPSPPPSAGPSSKTPSSTKAPQPATTASTSKSGSSNVKPTPSPPSQSAPKLSDHPALRRAPSRSAAAALLTPKVDTPIISSSSLRSRPVPRERDTSFTRTPDPLYAATHEPRSIVPTHAPAPRPMETLAAAATGLDRPMSATSGASSVAPEISLARQISIGKSQRQQVLTEVVPKSASAERMAFAGADRERRAAAEGPKSEAEMWEEGALELETRAVAAKRARAVEGREAQRKSESAEVEHS